VFPIFAWSLVNLARFLPAWLVRGLSTWELIGVIAYAQAFALLESALALGGLLFLCILLPARALRHRFVALGSMLVLVTSGWLMLVNGSLRAIKRWPATRFLPWIVFYLLSIAVPYVLIHRSNKIEQGVRATVDRLTVLSWLYVSLGCAGVVVVVIRNVMGAV
jgi:hypothetical protein